DYRRTLGDPWQTVADVPGYQGRYAWTVPVDNTSDARIRVRDLWDGTPQDTSDATFTVTSSGPWVDLISPNGAESWSYGSTQPIVWSSSGVPTVTLEYETQGSGPWKSIASGIAASASPYVWAIPFDMTSHARVR